MAPRPTILIALAVGLSITPIASQAQAPPAEPDLGRPIPIPSTTIPTIPPAFIDDALAIGGEDINARKARTRMTVEVRVNGRGPYSFVVDSGADTSAVGLKIAQELQLPLMKPVVLHGITESAIVRRVAVDELQLGASTTRALSLPALKEGDLGGDGMLGIDALSQQRLMLDFEKRTIKVEDARVPEVRQPDEILIVAKRKRGQLILTEVEANRFKIEAVVDTGSEITIGNLALRDKLIRFNRDKFVTIEVTGVTGATVKLQLARIAELKLGSVTLRDVPMAFADVAPFTVFDIKKGPALLLGTDLLETFRRISLDFRSRKVRFQLRRCGTSIVALSTSSGSEVSRLSSGGNAKVCAR